MQDLDRLDGLYAWSREKQGGVPDAWIVPEFCSGWSPHRALKTGRCSESDPHFLLNFFTQCYYPHTSRESVLPVCVIFLNFLFFYMQEQSEKVSTF